MQRAKVKAVAPAHPNTRLILRFNLVGGKRTDGRRALFAA